MTPDQTFWSGRRVLVTGHTGFKGSWLTTRLCELGAAVHGVSLPDSEGRTDLWEQLSLEGVSETRGDIAARDWTSPARDFSPEVVFHLAAQSLVTVGYQDPALTFRTNVLGTVQVLHLVSQLPELRSAVIVTTDKVYDVRQAPPYVEDHFLGGKDPYSASKACAEFVTLSWPGLEVPVVTARAGNVIGGGDWAAHRLVPDAVRAWSSGAVLTLRRPTAIRPWQHVIEPLEGYLAYAEALASERQLPRSLNFGPGASQRVSVLALVEFAAEEWERLTGTSPVRWDVQPASVVTETEDLTLDPTLARRALGWGGVWDWRTAISKTLEWYVATAGGKHPREMIRDQFADYASRL
ncbi:MAG TPA: CDP-glucose 4,6-dehydratase [Nocardioides sp.]|uniref:CDP-glucose 4,6-dehydratase n=1 Tax=Nocardioides sp. TaxID=35761 RepID=UPI002F41D9EB